MPLERIYYGGIITIITTNIIVAFEVSRKSPFYIPKHVSRPFMLRRILYEVFVYKVFQLDG